MLNEWFRSYKKIIILVVLLGSGIVFWFFGCRYDSTSMDVVMEWDKIPFENGGYGYHFKTDLLEGDVVFGIKGYNVKDKSIPVTITIDSAKNDFSGIVKISVPGANSGGIAYQSALQCTKNESQRRIIMVPQLGNASYFSFEIQDQYGNVILSKIESPEYSQWQDEESIIDQQICLGILSDNAGDLDYFDNLKVSKEDEIINIRTINLNEENFPDNLDSLRMISGLLVDNFDISSLSGKQLNTLLAWVKDGGHLILATGNHGSRVLRGISENFHIQSGEVETVRLYFGEASDFSGEIGLYLNQLHFDENAGWKRVDWSEPASFYEKNYGKGLVQAIRFSFTDETLLQWNRLNDMSESIMERLLWDVFTENDDKSDNLWYMEVALNDFLQSQMPNAFYYGIFFIVYLTSLTFIAYFTLRKRKKSEYIWIVAPLLAIFFTGCLLLRSRGNTNTVQKEQNSLSAIRIVDSENQKNEIYFLYQNAEGEGKNLDFISAIDEVKPLNFEYGQEEVNVSKLRIIKEDYTISRTIKGYNVNYSETRPGSIRMLEMTEDKSSNYGEKNLKFSTSLKGSYTSFSGDIINDPDKNFDKLIVIRGNQYWTTDQVKKGQSITIKDKDVKCWSQNNDDQEEIYDEQDDSSMRDILTYVCNRYLNNNNALDEYIIVGISFQDHYQLLKGGDSLGNQVSVYVNHVQAEFSEKIDYRVNINLNDMSDKTEYEDIIERLSTEDVEVKYQFDSNKTAWMLIRNRDSYQGRIFAYNYETEEMDEILSNPDDCIYAEELEKYLSEDNEMKLRYEQAKDAMTYHLPVISMWLKKSVN